MMEELLQNRKKEIIEQIGEGECGLNELKFSKLLKLLENEIQALFMFYTIKQVYQMVQDVFNVNISAPLFYRFAKTIKKDEKSKPLKRDKIEEGVSQKIDTNEDEKSFKNIDDLTDSTLDFISKNLPKK